MPENGQSDVANHFSSILHNKKASFSTECKEQQ
jgi:hypothetical protein